MTFSALIVGLGRIGMGYDLELPAADFVYSHARALGLHHEFELIGAVDPEERERILFQSAYGAPAYASIEEALTARKPDMVIIASPTAAHYKSISEVLNLASPKAILCEKPLEIGRAHV